MEYKRQRVQFGWLDLKKEKEWPGGLGVALQGNFSGRLKTSAKCNRWISRKVSNRVAGTYGKHVAIAVVLGFTALAGLAIRASRHETPKFARQNKLIVVQHKKLNTVQRNKLR
jgi:hypothetical protein